MNIGKTICALIIVGVVTVLPGLPQSPRRSASAAEAARAAGGRVYANIEPSETPPDLDMLIHMSRLIIEGTVSEVLPAVEATPGSDLPLVETYSRVTVTKVLSAVAVPNPSTIFVVQSGGKAGKWDMVTPEAPLLQKGERYIFFLGPDRRPETAYAPGIARYTAVGVWSGFVKVQNGKVRFLPSSAAALHDADDMLVDAFVKFVLQRVDVVVPKDQIIMDHTSFALPPH